MLSLAVIAVTLLSPALAGAEDLRQPNIIVITTDDQRSDAMNAQVMPDVMRLIARRGARFERSIVATPLCCPSRATFLTGQYGHNNGVLWNIPGYPDLRDPESILPAWLRAAGYRTVHVGKYMNGLPKVTDPAVPPVGWAQWHTLIEPWRYYDYTLGVNGRRIELGSGRSEYVTSVLNRRAKEMIRRYGPGDRPLFMVVDHFAPHTWPGPGHVNRCAPTGPEPAWRDRRRFGKKRLPRPPSFIESDVSDKPSFIRGRPVPDRSRVAERTRSYRCALASLRAVDRGVNGIWRALEAVGERRETVLVFTSDNGFYYGEHRLVADVDKTLPYRESVEVPLAIRLPAQLRPRRARGLRIRELVADVDLAPTLVDLARAVPCAGSRGCRTLDGRSLLPLVRGRGSGWPKRRAIPIELDVGPPRASPSLSCRYQGVWARNHVYIHHTAFSQSDGRCVPTDESEHYDLKRDPFQLDNRFPAPLGSTDEQTQRRLAARAERLADCAGIAGRDPDPVGRIHCE